MVADGYVTSAQAAELLGISKSAVYSAIKDGRIKSELVLNRLAIRRAEVEAYRQRTAAVGPKGGRPATGRKPRVRKKKGQTE